MDGEKYKALSILLAVWISILKYCFPVEFAIFTGETSTTYPVIQLRFEYQL